MRWEKRLLDLFSARFLTTSSPSHGRLRRPPIVVASSETRLQKTSSPYILVLHTLATRLFQRPKISLAMEQMISIVAGVLRIDRYV